MSKPASTWNTFRWTDLVVALLLWLAFRGGVTPGPAPDPTPTPLTAVAIVEETADRSKLPAPQRALLGNATFRESVTAKGLAFRRIDKDDLVTPEWQWAKDAATGKTLPVLSLLAGGKGSAIPLPADEAAALAVVNGGGK